MHSVKEKKTHTLENKTTCCLSLIPIFFLNQGPKDSPQDFVPDIHIIKHLILFEIK